jgi:hypothetical protein
MSMTAAEIGTTGERHATAWLRGQRLALLSQYAASWCD